MSVHGALGDHSAANPASVGSASRRIAPSGSAPQVGAVLAGGVLGRETVVNPEGRPAPLDMAGSAEGSSVQRPLSGLARQLFPGVPDGEAPPLDTCAEDPLKLGPYTIVRRIRSGGMGAVFLGVDHDLGRMAALKVLPPQFARDPQSVQRFQHEARASALLSHESIARVYASGLDQGLHYIAFEFVDGTNIRDVLASGQPMAVTDAIRVTYQIAVALRHMAQRGVVHRDIKPSNIILTPQGSAKLVDFGLARSESRTESQQDMTIAGTTLGTFDYISPEQARDPRQADIRSDIYSLGCTLYHMLTGQPPYPEGTVLQKLLQHQGDEAPDPVRKNRKVPAALSAIVRTMMAKDVRKRYPAVEPLLRDIALVAAPLGVRLGQAGEMAVPVSREAGPIRKFVDRHLVWLASVAALIGLALVLEYGFSGKRPGSGPNPQGSHAASKSTEGANHRSSVSRLAIAQLFPESDPLAPTLGVVGRSLPIAGSSSPSIAKPGENPGTAAKPPAISGSQSGNVGAAKGAGEVAASAGAARLDEIGRAGSRRSDGQVVASGDALLPPPAPDNRLSAPVIARELGLVAAVAPSQIDQTAATNLAEIVRLPGPNRGSAAGPSAEAESVGRSTTGLVPASTAGTANKGASSPADADGASAPFTVRGKDGVTTRFASLEAACAAAQDGALIELRFNGIRKEGVCKIAHRVSIRGARGFRPIVEFVPVRVAGEGWLTRMIVVSGGGLDLSGVELRFSPLADSLSSGGALVSVQRADYLRITDCGLTLTGGTQSGLSAVELDASAAMRMPDMDLDRAAARATVSIEIERCLVRGQGDGVLIRGSELARVQLRQSVVALAGTLLRSFAGTESAGDPQPNELRIDHATVATSGGVLRIDSGRMPRRGVPLAVRVSNSILAGYGGYPLVASSGEAPRSDQRVQLNWTGRRNYYTGYTTLWSVGQDDPLAVPEQIDLSGWRQKWSETEADSPSIAQPWALNWSDAASSEMTAESFSLTGDSGTNPTVGGSESGENAGADLRLLAPLGRGTAVAE